MNRQKIIQQLPSQESLNNFNIKWLWVGKVALFIWKHHLLQWACCIQYGCLFFNNPVISSTHNIITHWYWNPLFLLLCTHYSTGVDVWFTKCIYAEIMYLCQWDWGLKKKKKKATFFYKKLGCCLLAHQMFEEMS